MPDRYISFDLEMPNRRGRRICAIGITVIEDGKITDRFYSLVNPEVKFDRFIVDMIGITPEMVADKPTFPEIWEQIKDLMDSGTLVAYNAPSDLRVLAICLRHYKIEWKSEINCICTYMMGLNCYPDLERHSLDALCENLGISLYHHNAASDSEGSARLLLNYIENGMEVEKYTITYDMEKQKKKRDTSVKIKIASGNGNVEENIQKLLFEMSDKKVRESMTRRLHNIPPETVIGVETDRLRSLANELYFHGGISGFLEALPHEYHEENNLHAMLISRRKKFSVCMKEIEAFFPYINNLETCDLLRPLAFKAGNLNLKRMLRRWLASGNKYRIVFALNTINGLYANEKYFTEFLKTVSNHSSSKLPVNTRRIEFMLAALKTDYDKTLPYIKSGAFNRATLERLEKAAVREEKLSEEQKQLLQEVINERLDRRETNMISE